ncbi:MAG: nucleotidyltransferase family protein [Leptolyngbyaceae bacterium]|nr:nucleotidyltransferase family protein [Leptolyngbyaceae bacterium]
MRTLFQPPILPVHPRAYLESAALLHLVRAHLNKATVDPVSLTGLAELNWENILTLAQQHGVTALLYNGLVQVCPESAPSQILKQLHAQVQANAVMNLFLTEELCRLLDFLASHGILAIPFKGPILAAIAYGNLAMRKSGDLDILVAERDFCRTRDLMIAHGYDPAIQPWFLNEAQEHAYHASRNECLLLRQDKRVAIDLHRKLAAGDFFLLPLDLDRVWNVDHLWPRLQSVSLAGKSIPTLTPEDCLLFLCVHGSKHLWLRLIWICDIAALLHSYPQLNWDWMIQQAQVIGCQRMLWVGVQLAHELLDAPLPERVSQTIQSDATVRWLTARVTGWLFRPHGSLAKGFSWQRIIFHCQELELLQDKVQYCYRSAGHYGLAPLRRAITPTFRDRHFLQLPSWLSFLYYLVRPVRLIRDFGQRARHSLYQRLNIQ